MWVVQNRKLRHEIRDECVSAQRRDVRPNYGEDLNYKVVDEPTRTSDLLDARALANEEAVQVAQVLLHAIARNAGQRRHFNEVLAFRRQLRIYKFANLQKCTQMQNSRHSLKSTYEWLCNCSSEARDEERAGDLGQVGNWRSGVGMGRGSRGGLGGEETDDLGWRSSGRGRG